MKKLLFLCSFFITPSLLHSAKTKSYFKFTYPLHAATIAGDKKAIEELTTTSNFDANQKDFLGMTPQEWETALTMEPSKKTHRNVIRVMKNNNSRVRLIIYSMLQEALTSAHYNTSILLRKNSAKKIRDFTIQEVSSSSDEEIIS